MVFVRRPRQLLDTEVVNTVNYVNYCRLALDLVSAQGVMLIDNVLWDGDVLKQPAPGENTAANTEDSLASGRTRFQLRVR